MSAFHVKTVEDFQLISTQHIFLNCGRTHNPMIAAEGSWNPELCRLNATVLAKTASQTHVMMLLYIVSSCFDNVEILLFERR